METSNLILLIVISTIRMSIPMVLASSGAAFSMRAGVSDLGCEGMMISGSLFAVIVSYYTGSAWLGLLGGILAGGVISMLHAVMHVTYRVNATISGMCINLLGLAISPLILQLIWQQRNSSSRVSAFSPIKIDALDKIPVLGNILNQQNVLFYLSVVFIIIGYVFMFRTTKGLRMRMVGENPQAASTVGINVTGYKYFGVLMCGLLCGMGGAYLSIGQLDLFVDGMTAGRGYIAVVINAFGRYNPIGALFGSMFFGFFDSLQVIFQDSGVPNQVMRMIPYLFTLVVIAFGVRRSHTPAGVGKFHDS
ncbi:Branched-chain amino acid transport system / permease component [Clostridium sp. C105KSO15]|nr:Branched-chain amino acid transport system / permease component [Clostridium sp. C105KSO15]